jgi:hypothetical protein
MAQRAYWQSGKASSAADHADVVAARKMLAQIYRA